MHTSSPDEFHRVFFVDIHLEPKSKYIGTLNLVEPAVSAGKNFSLWLILPILIIGRMSYLFNCPKIIIKVQPNRS